MSTGLALESSDMDLAVTNIFMESREKMIEGLERLANRLKIDMNIKNLQTITTATIPVIKAEADLIGIRQEMKPVEPRGFGGHIPKDLRMLKIDITFDDNLE